MNKKLVDMITLIIVFIFVVGLILICVSIFSWLVEDGTDLGLSVFSTIVVVGLCFVIGRTIVNTVLQKIFFITSPNLTSFVKVISKDSDITSRYIRGIRYTNAYHFIAFEFPDGIRKSFIVDITQFNTIIENEIGTLIYRENRGYLFFVDFQRQKGTQWDINTI